MDYKCQNIIYYSGKLGTKTVFWREKDFKLN